MQAQQNIIDCRYRKSLENFVVKNFCSQWRLRKLVRTIDANAVRGRFYENLSYKNFFTRKFPDLRYSL